MTPKAAATPHVSASQRLAAATLGFSPRESPAINRGKSVVILIAETDRIVLGATSEELAVGFETIEVCTAAEALVILEGHAAVGMLITGRSIVGNGVALAHLVHHRWPSIGIIVTSGIGWDHQRDLPPGARLLRKPYAFADMIREVEAGLALVDR